jgi:hypothetical protein
VGVRGIAPNVIPNMCLHAGAATISISIGARGPVFGAGGGPMHVADGLFAAAATLLDNPVPGVWLALTDWNGDLANGAGHGVALALVSANSADAAWNLAIRTGRPGPIMSPGRLTGLIDFLARSAGNRWDHPLDGGGEISLMAEDT